MDELFLKSFELGALGLISIFLLTKGLNAIKDLSDSNRQLADAVSKLSDKVNSMEHRFSNFEYEFRTMRTQLDKILTHFERSNPNENIH